MRDSRDLHLPLMFFGLLALVLLSRLDATRDYLARGISVVLAPVTIGRGVSPFKDADGLLRPAAFATAAATAIASEMAVGGALASAPWSVPTLHVLYGVLLTGALAAVVLEGLQGRHGVRTRFAGWSGIAVAFSLYMPAHYRPENAFGTVLGGFFLALLIGGGIGVLSGAAAVSWLRRA